MAYPATIDVQTPAKLSNWRAIGQVFMAIPHLIISNALTAVAEVCALISWFAIVFTGKMPVGLSNMITMSLRYQLRATGYAAFLHDQYPPFEFPSAPADPGDTPLQVNVQPTLEGRNRVTVGFRLLLVIPAALFAVVVMLVACICQLLAFFAVLFTGEWPSGLRNWVLKGLRVMVRLNAYLFLLTDEYPPFATD